MAESIIEQIAQAIVTKLKTITAANGYANTVSEVVRPRRTGENFHPADKGISVLQDNAERETSEDIVGNPPAIGWRQPFTIDLFLRHSEKNTVPMDQALNSFIADVQKALMADVQWGGLAIRSDLGSVDYAEPSRGFEGATVWIEVIYRVAENDPYLRI